ncbi:MAG: TfuA-like protein [Alphaproteobacteria bacterium]
MTATVFLGPTLPIADARRTLDAVYLPPVRQGDVYRAVTRHRPEVIGIVDGYFHQVPSVWHKEILWAMAEGVHVLGSASMGALRAAELHPFGMEGVGQIFSAFQSGVLEDDDEVAVLHGPADLGFVAASEAMVNIRSTLDAARTDGVIGGSTAEHLARIAKSLFYAKRRYAAMLEQAAAEGLPTGELAAFEAWLKTGRIDRKREDALAMLARMGELLAGELPGKPVDYSFEHTSLWESAITTIGQGDGVSDGPDNDAIEPWLLDEIRLDDACDDLRRAALLRRLALDEADRHGLGIAEDEHRDAAMAFRSARKLQRGADLRAWLEAHDLERRDVDRLVQEGLLLDKVSHLHGHRVTEHMIDQLRLCGRYRPLIERARAKRQALAPIAKNPELPDDIRALTWYFSACGMVPPDDLDIYARRRGFRDGADFRRAVARDYLFRKISDEASLDE